ncbi:RNA dependent RNA polymerase [Streptococcus mutans]|uniref:RNA dependent RNA polymerase n=1 Tax=Streptococcus mutans TaxID=1309 RepID=UPI0004AED5F7|nr:RNA dependent RNA polymerase [Streptococcus mutans]
MGGIIAAIRLSLEEISVGFRWIILFICCMTAFVASIIGVRLLWRKGNLSPYQPTAYQVRELLEKGKHQRIG